MDKAKQSREVDENYDAFQRQLGKLLPDHRDEYALMRSRKIVGFYADVGDAFRAGISKFPDQIFSIQEVTDQPIDLGLASYV